MPAKIRGKNYAYVHERISAIHNADICVGCSINTEIVWEKEQSDGLREILMKSTVTIEQDGNVYTFDGYAHEVESKSGVNSTSYIENCETSARGRALTAAGYGGEEGPSAEEMKYALDADTEKRGAEQHETKPSTKPQPKAEPEKPQPKAEPENPEPPQSQDDMAERARLHARQEAGEAYSAAKDALDGMGLTGDVFNGAVYYHFQVGTADEMTLRNYRHLKDDLTDGFASWIHAASKNIGVEPEERIEVPMAEDKEEPAKIAMRKRRRCACDEGELDRSQLTTTGGLVPPITFKRGIMDKLRD